ncbi:MAG TPA: M48 family metalloprotease [Burkholderiales bacterium]
MRILALALLVLVPCGADAQIPGIFGDVLRSVQKAAAPEDDEFKIGRQLAGNLLGAVPLAKDAALQRYVNRVGRWVASQSDRPELKWYFGVLESDDVNAFALPGGYVFVTRGLFNLLASEAELAGVLGHEIGHVVLKHHLKVLKQSQMVDTVSGLAASQAGGELAQRALGKGAEALARGLDKNAEFEADRAGVVLATRAGYSPYGLPTALRSIAERNPREASLALLFKTHPLPQERLQKLGDAMGEAFERYDDGKTLKERFAAAR